jgi:CheY-like chemotaxis protein
MPYKLLVADDSVTIQRVIELTFADEDIEVTAVGDGQEAVDRILSDRPDIVLADVDMPRQNGYEVAAFMKNDPALEHIPVLLLTGAFEPIDEPRARAVRSDGVVAKPFEPQVLISRVKELLGRATSLPAGASDAGQPPDNEPDDRPVAPAIDDRPLDLESLEPQPGQSAHADMSLDDYFDRLDAAFANLTGTPAGHEGAAAAPPASGGPAAADADPEDAGGHLVTFGPGGSLSVSEAFAALLDAEQMFDSSPVHDGQPPWAAAPPAEATINEAFIDNVARRVTERMGEAALREAVVQAVSVTAERLIREEIERLKATIK